MTPLLSFDVGPDPVHSSFPGLQTTAPEIAALRAELSATRQHLKQALRDLWTLRGGAGHHVAGLTMRQREIMALVLAGHPSKNIAADLGISRRTVENHRAAIMRRTGSPSIPALARLGFTADSAT